MSDVYCSIIHKGLELDLRNSVPTAQPCCLRTIKFPIDVNKNFWNGEDFNGLRRINQKNIWASGCENCQQLESAGAKSYRNGANQGLGVGEYNLSGPAKIVMQFDISCNLACRSCDPATSTKWQKHLKENNLWDKKISSPRNYQDAIAVLKQLDLSNLKTLVFTGGEPLLGQTHWAVAEWLANNVPNAKQQLTLCFQTNGTQSILEKNYELINQFHLIKLHVSLDGVGSRFNYLRWPASWDQVTDNIMHVRETAPNNVMFLIEETISIFNLYYQHELDAWVKNNFATNRDGDIVNHSQHIAHGMFNLHNCSQPYVDYIKKTGLTNLVPKDWKENISNIQSMLKEIQKFDQLRGESFAKTFPEVAEFYSNYL
jgi:organic radical activating enzyme